MITTFETVDISPILQDNYTIDDFTNVVTSVADLLILDKSGLSADFVHVDANVYCKWSTIISTLTGNSRQISKTVMFVFLYTTPVSELLCGGVTQKITVGEVYSIESLAEFIILSPKQENLTILVIYTNIK